MNSKFSFAIPRNLKQLIWFVIRYNRLLHTIDQSSQDLLKAIKGLVVMSESLEKMFNSLYINEVPLLWAGKVGSICRRTHSYSDMLLFNN